MGTMSYCIFENTYIDLEECYTKLQEEESVKSLIEKSNQYEKPYIKKLIEMCIDIADEFSEELEEL